VPKNTVPELSERMDELIALAFRRHWWFSITASAVAIGVALGSFLLPNRYKSEATILVQRQQIPERYVVPNSTTDLDQALRAMTHDVLSRPRLRQIISKFNLYPKQRKRFSSEQLVELMRSDITIQALENPNQGQKTTNAFTISYLGSNPGVAQQVAGELTSLFINEDLASQQRRDITTTNFLQVQLVAAQKDLNTKEQRLRAFKMANLGELPEQREVNLQILSGLQEQLRNTNAALARANEQHEYLESLLAQYRNLSQISGSASLTATSANSIETPRVALNRLQSQRTALLGTYSPQHPDVQKIDREIAETKALLAQFESSKPAASSSELNSSSGSSGVTANDTTVAQLISQLKQNQLEVSNDTAQAKQLQQQIGQYQQRLNLTPVREQQLMDLLRDYDLAKKNYDDLYSKKTQSALATDLQKDQQGEQFRLIEPPNLPTKPFTPNRLRIALGGIAGGIVLGIALCCFIETRDASLYSEKQLREQFDLPVVMAIPRFISTRERRLESLKSRLQWCGGSIMLLAVVVAEYFVYRQG
jgi:polysaccharide chain length determinant protein (PEP-CTERM system associated)